MLAVSVVVIILVSVLGTATISKDPHHHRSRSDSRILESRQTVETPDKIHHGGTVPSTVRNDHIAAGSTDDHDDTGPTDHHDDDGGDDDDDGGSTDNHDISRPIRRRGSVSESMGMS